MDLPIPELPESFIASLKSLFSIVSGDGSSIKLKDLETKFRNENNNIPKDILLALRGLSIKNGDISFDMFVTAISIASTVKSEHSQNENKKSISSQNPSDDRNSNVAYNDSPRFIKPKMGFSQPFVINPPISPIPKYEEKSNSRTRKREAIKLGKLAYSMPNLDQIDSNHQK